MSKTPAPKPNRGSTRDAAKNYIASGFKPIPIPHGEKAPTINGWQNLDITAADVDHMFPVNSNIGVLLGKSGLADIDLDVREAAQLAPMFLQPTRVFGRLSKPNSHYIYRTRERRPTTRYQFLDATLVEYRDSTKKGTPAQTVFPPSTHTSGERICWTGSRDEELALVDADDLARRVRLLAAATALTLLWPKHEGGRHDLAGALAGVLVRSEAADVVDIAKLVFAIADFAGDDEAYDREAFAQQTVDSYRDDPTTQMTGLPRLMELMCPDDKSERALKKALGWLGFDAGPGPSVSAQPQRLTWSTPEPIPHPSDRRPVPTFDPAWLPDGVRAWVEDVARRTQTALDFGAAAVLVVLASCIGRRVGIRPKQRDSWTVIPNLWGLIVARPGQMKSPVIKAVMAPLTRLQAQATAAFVAETKAYDLAVQAHDVRTASRKRAANVALKGDLNADLSAFFENGAEPEPPTRIEYVVNDTTPEALIETCRDNPMGVLHYRDEASGLLARLQDRNAGEERALYLNSWNGNEGVNQKRIIRGYTSAEAVCQSILGGIQPGKLSGLTSGAVQGGAADDGMMQRFQVLVYPDVPASYEFVDEWPDKEAKQVAFELVEALVALDAFALGAEQETGFDGAPTGVPYLRFDEKAQLRFNAYLIDLEGRLRSGDLHPAIESHLAKYRSLVPSLALILHLADGSSGNLPKGPVSFSALSRAIEIAEYLEAHALRVYSAQTATAETDARRLGRRLIDGELGEAFTVRTLYRKNWSGIGKAEQAQAAVDVLVDHGWLRAETEKKGSRTFTQYAVNPAVRGALRTAMLPDRTVS